jgi:hypothetical protein
VPRPWGVCCLAAYSLFVRLSTGSSLTLLSCHHSCLHPIAKRNRWFTVRTAVCLYPAMLTNGRPCPSWLSAKPVGLREPTDLLKCSWELHCKFGSVHRAMENRVAPFLHWHVHCAAWHPDGYSDQSHEPSPAPRYLVLRCGSKRYRHPDDRTLVWKRFDRAWAPIC